MCSVCIFPYSAFFDAFLDIPCMLMVKNSHYCSIHVCTCIINVNFVALIPQFIFFFLTSFSGCFVKSIFTHARKLHILFVYHIVLSCFVRIIFSMRISAFFFFRLTASQFRTFFFFYFIPAHIRQWLFKFHSLLLFTMPSLDIEYSVSFSTFHFF